MEQLWGQFNHLKRFNRKNWTDWDFLSPPSITCSVFEKKIPLSVGSRTTRCYFAFVAKDRVQWKIPGQIQEFAKRGLSLPLPFSPHPPLASPFEGSKGVLSVAPERIWKWGGGTGPEQKWGYQSGAKRWKKSLVVPLYFFGSISTISPFWWSLLWWSVQFGQFLVCCSTRGAPRAQPFVKVRGWHVPPCPIESAPLGPL